MKNGVLLQGDSRREPDVFVTDGFFLAARSGTRSWGHQTPCPLRGDAFVWSDDRCCMQGCERISKMECETFYSPRTHSTQTQHTRAYTRHTPLTPGRLRWPTRAFASPCADCSPHSARTGPCMSLHTKCTLMPQMARSGDATTYQENDGATHSDTQHNTPGRARRGHRPRMTHV